MDPFGPEPEASEALTTLLSPAPNLHQQNSLNNAGTVPLRVL